MTEEARLRELRGRIDEVDGRILALLRDRGAIVEDIMTLKRSRGLDSYDAPREEEILKQLVSAGTAPLDPVEVKEIFRSIFRASLGIDNRERSQELRVRQPGIVPAGGIVIGDVAVGTGAPVLFAGPCSVETPDQIETIASFISDLPGKKILRGGAFKPRTNPYSFQGLREEGLSLLHDAAARHGLATVTEVPDTSAVDVVAASADMLQVGARNMSNTELLKALGRVGKPVLLKRGLMSTIEELLMSAEYIVKHGNNAVVLCERGIRTFERWTRNTLDISAVPILKQETDLPVIVDLSHSLGRTDVMIPCARAALAAGADGLMIEAHHMPEQALSDGFQQLDLPGLRALVDGIQPYMEMNVPVNQTTPPPRPGASS
ncbi:MAG: bifunctional 3-deoxy-7-phosphoheptulonate synthase/chorismate mutase [Acidobacteriota bacterium]